MSRPRIHFYFHGVDVTNNSALSSKASKGVNTSSMTQATSSNQPQSKSSSASSSSQNASATLLPIVSSAVCDGSDYMSLPSSETIPVLTPYTIVFAWTAGDYTNDAYLISSNSNDAHYGIEAGGDAIIAKPNGSKAAAAARRYGINDTNNGTVAYTFGSDVETLVIVNNGDLSLDFYNIDGDKIASVTNSLGMNSSFPIDHFLGKSDGTKGLNAEILDIAVYSSVQFNEGTAQAYGNWAKGLKDLS